MFQYVFLSCIVIFCLSYYHVLSVNKDREKELHTALQCFDLQLNFHFIKVDATFHYNVVTRC